MKDKSILSVGVILSWLVVATSPNLYGGEQQANNKFNEAKQSEKSYLQAAELIGKLIENKSYKEALSSVDRMRPGFLKASMFMEISAALRNDGIIEQANSLLEAAFDELRFEDNAALKASTLALLSDEFKQSGNNIKASKVLDEARVSLYKIERFETGIELSAVFAVAKSYASKGDIATAETVARLVNAQPGDSLMTAIKEIAERKGRTP